MRCWTTPRRTSKATHSRCGPSKRGVRRSKTIGAATTRPAGGSGCSTSSRRPARSPGWVRRDMSRILLIDDTPEIAELLTYALRDHGFEVVTTGFDPAIGEL